MTGMTFTFPKEITQIKSRKTGKIYSLARADKVLLGETAIKQISKVCDEPEVYENVFAEIFKGKRYSEDNACTFTKLVSEGWVKANRFDWLILHEEEIVGTIGIKSLEGEIGYWQSNKHPGVMTSATQTLCSLAQEAGFSSLWAYVKKENAASINVLESAGFKLDADLTAKRGDTYGYRISF
jgi:RimJ/RimL family protein N-acetyltransferase